MFATLRRTVRRSPTLFALAAFGAVGWLATGWSLSHQGAAAASVGGPIVGNRVLEIRPAGGSLRVVIFATESGNPLVLNVDRIVLVDEDVN